MTYFGPFWPVRQCTANLHSFWWFSQSLSECPTMLSMLSIRLSDTSRRYLKSLNTQDDILGPFEHLRRLPPKHSFCCIFPSRGAVRGKTQQNECLGGSLPMCSKCPKMSSWVFRNFKYLRKVPESFIESIDNTVGHSERLWKNHPKPCILAVLCLTGPKGQKRRNFRPSPQL